MQAALLFLAGSSLLVCLLLVALSCSARPPVTGLYEGRLRPCPAKPNCVCSEDRQVDSWVAPLEFDGSSTQAWEHLKEVLQEMGGTITRQGDEYIWATFRTKVFRFVDDVEFRMAAEENVIHVRSASRVGYSDLGLNKRRIEAIRSRFSAAIQNSGRLEAR